MIMDFHAPSTIDELSSLLSNSSEKKHLLAGGTDLLVQMQSQIIEPSTVIDIKNISEMMVVMEDTRVVFTRIPFTIVDKKKTQLVRTNWVYFLIFERELDNFDFEFEMKND